MPMIICRPRSRTVMCMWRFRLVPFSSSPLRRCKLAKIRRSIWAVQVAIGIPVKRWQREQQFVLCKVICMLSVGAPFSTSNASRIAIIIREADRAIALCMLNLHQQRLRFEHVAFRLIPQFVGVLLVDGWTVRSRSVRRTQCAMRSCNTQCLQPIWKLKRETDR